jgi:predicted Zn finger-like uncharacterized protein
MVVGCPKCRAKLRVSEEKISREGSRFRCPRCSAVMLVRRPAPREAFIDRDKIMVAHENPEVPRRVSAALRGGRYQVLEARDGVEAMIKAMKERPFLSILDMGLPKIQGFEISRRLKARPETRDMTVLLVSSEHDPRRQRKGPASSYGAGDYLDERHIEEELPRLVESLEGAKKEAPLRREEKPLPPPGQPEEDVQRARRLARTVLSDIDLYSGEKVARAIRDNNFHEAFANELREGLRHYENRIPPNVRSKGDFFNQAIEEFVDRKRKALNL